MTRRTFKAFLTGLAALASAFAAAAATIPSPVHPFADPLRAAALHLDASKTAFGGDLSSRSVVDAADSEAEMVTA